MDWIIVIAVICVHVQSAQTATGGTILRANINCESEHPVVSYTIEWIANLNSAKAASGTHSRLLAIQGEDASGLTIELEFQLPSGQLHLKDLQDAFPKAVSLRYKDAPTAGLRHVMCRDASFVEPEGGWCKEGRKYLAIPGAAPNSDRRSAFEAFRTTVSGNRSSRKTSAAFNSVSPSAEPTQSDDIYIKVGRGKFVAGSFTKILKSNGPQVGGLVVVGPFSKSVNNSNEIVDAAYRKFCARYQQFRRKYKENKFTLVYEDGSPVDKLPDDSGEFTLTNYRKFVDPKMKYEAIRLYLCETARLEQSGSDASDFEEDKKTKRKPVTFEVSSDEGDDNVDLPPVDFGGYGRGLPDLPGPEQPSGTSCPDRPANIGPNDKDTLYADLLFASKEGMSVDEETETKEESPICTRRKKTKGLDANPEKLKELLQKLAGKMVKQEQSINVCRISLWNDVMGFLRKARFDPRKGLKVTFGGEDSVDHGGPRRELFRLWLNALQNSRLFAGTENRKVLTNNFHASEAREFYHAGVMLVLCFIQGGEAFPVCSHALYEYIAGTPIRKIFASYEDIPDEDTKKKKVPTATLR